MQRINISGHFREPLRGELMREWVNDNGPISGAVAIDFSYSSLLGHWYRDCSIDRMMRMLAAATSKRLLGHR